MSNCSICNQDYQTLSIVDTSSVLSQSPLNICNRCSAAIKNAELIKKQFKHIKDKDTRGQYINLLLDLCKVGTDNYKGDECVRLLEAPAGRRKHHSYSGGLLNHIVQMINISFVIYGQNTSPFHRILNKGDIVIGCFIHDLHKAINTFVRDDKNNNASFRYTHPNKYLTNDMQSLLILMDYGIELTEDHLNCLFMAEGGFSDLADKLESSKLAVIVSMADLYSSQALKR
ncbi:hypothetical protein D4R86_03040 [bacterium]|nr:MAG: hypothetical protein D4R86_03040 [bacterium]